MIRYDYVMMYDQETRDLPDLAPWSAAQVAHLRPLADAALAVGRLDADVVALPPDQRAGFLRRLALIEVDEILWAEGRPLPREDIAVDLMDARAASDPEAVRFSRWAVRRLEGQSKLDDLRAFLGLHRVESAGQATWLRPTGIEFDEAAQMFQTGRQGASGLYPLARAPFLRMLWRLADLSPDAAGGEAAIWIARDMAAGCQGLTFLPLGRGQRRLLTEIGTPEERLGRHLELLTEGTRSARRMLGQLNQWRREATEITDQIKGRTPSRIISAVAAQPLISAAAVAQATGISRLTAERQLARLQEIGLIREITGAKRFRLWSANLGG